MENKFEYIEKKVIELGFRINSKDFNRPWGGFLVIDENHVMTLEELIDNLEEELEDKVTLEVHDFGVVAEIWQHTDLNNPSDENDIVRIQDDYGR